VAPITGEKSEPEKAVVKKQKRSGELSCEFKAFKVKVMPSSHE